MNTKINFENVKKKKNKREKLRKDGLHSGLNILERQNEEQKKHSINLELTGHVENTISGDAQTRNQIRTG